MCDIIAISTHSFLTPCTSRGLIVDALRLKRVLLHGFSCALRTKHQATALHSGRHDEQHTAARQAMSALNPAESLAFESSSIDLEHEAQQRFHKVIAGICSFHHATLHYCLLLCRNHRRVEWSKIFTALYGPSIVLC